MRINYYIKMCRLASASEIILIVVIALVVTLVKSAEVPSDSLKKSPDPCSKITCTSPPEGLKCNKTIVKNPTLLKKIGALKDCCSAWRCQEADGSFSTYFGLTGADGAPASLGVGNGSNSESSSQSKCPDKNATCPLPDAGDDSCAVSSIPTNEALSFKSKSELDSCCPIYNCTKPDGSFHLHSLIGKGKMTKDKNAILLEKGPAVGDKKCSKITCSQEPAVKDDGPICEMSTDDDSSRIKALDSFRECCDLWKCAYPNGSYYTQFELHAATFSIVETTFRSPENTNESSTTEAPNDKNATETSEDKNKSPNDDETESSESEQSSTDPTVPTNSVSVVSVAPAVKARPSKKTPKKPKTNNSGSGKPKKSKNKKKKASTTTTTSSQAMGGMNGKTKTVSSTSAQSSSSNTVSSSVSNWSGQMGSQGMTVTTSETDMTGDPSTIQGQNLSPSMDMGLPQQNNMQMSMNMMPPPAMPMMQMQMGPGPMMPLPMY